jgi:tetratricopeptide (TPR) repeat protein
MADVERHRLNSAVKDYQAALAHYREDEHPAEFALANSNLAIALLSMPTSQAQDQIRLGVAVQSLRAALRVYTPGSDPDRWSSCQMNLANALQYLPSTHRKENLEEAVDLYQEVLAVRSAARDPLGYARVLANQANALAHLAAFDQAEERYVEARRLFESGGDADAAQVVDRQLAEIDRSRLAAGLTGGPTAGPAGGLTGGGTR